MFANDIMSKIRNKLYYFKIVVYIVLFCITIIITMSIVFYNIYKNSLVESITEEYLNSLDRVNVNIENLIKQADNFYTSMMFDANINAFLNSHDEREEVILAYKAQNAATQTKNIIPYVHSICLYNVYLESYLSTVSPQDTYDVTNDILKKSILNSNVSGKRNIKRLHIDNSKKLMNESYIISIKYKEISIDKTYRNSILININEELIKRDIFKNLSGSSIIINEDGEKMVSVELEEQEDNTVIDFVMKNAIANNMTKGNLIFKSSQDTYLITYVKSNMLNWYVINAIPYGSITQNTRNRIILFNIICIAILLTFIVIAFFVSSRIYSPIRQVIETLKKKTRFSNINGNGEIPLIMDIVDEILEKINELNNVNEKSITLLKENFLRRLIITGSDGDKERDSFNEYGIKINSTNLLLVLIKIDDYKLLKEKNVFIIETVMCTAIEDVLENDFNYETIRMYHGEICILMNYLNNKINKFDTLLMALERIKDTINKVIGFTITIGIGNAINSISEFHMSYKKANDMVKYRFILGTNMVLYGRYIEENLMRGLIYPVELKEQLLVSIRLGNLEKFEETLKRIVDLLKKYVYYDVIVIFYKIILDCTEEMNNIIEGVKSIELDFGELSSFFQELLTLDEAKEWLLKQFKEYQEKVEKVKNSKQGKYWNIVEETKRYIQDNCEDINLGLEMFAEKMNYSPKYFSKIFKEISGLFLGDYIRQVRINKAKELLREDKCKIEEIVIRIGFVNTSYFYSTFKNEVGMTPSEYKNYYIKTADDNRTS